MNKENRHLQLISARRAAVYSAEEDEEVFIISDTGEVVRSILPHERRAAPLFGFGGKVLYINRMAEIDGLCGCGIYDNAKNAHFGTWGRYSGRFASAARFVSMHAAELLEGKKPAEILTNALRPCVQTLLSDELAAGHEAAEIKTALRTMIKDEALRHGISLECYIPEFMGYIKE